MEEDVAIKMRIIRYLVFEIIKVKTHALQEMTEHASKHSPILVWQFPRYSEEPVDSFFNADGRFEA